MKTLAWHLAVGVFLCIPASALADTYSFQTISNPGDSTFTKTLGINNASTVTGYFGDGTIVPNKGFTTAPPYNTSFTPENFPGSAQTQVVGINTLGETVGFWIDSGGVTHGFTDSGGTFTNIDNPNTTTVTELLGVNDSGTAAGYWVDAGGVFHPFTSLSNTFTSITFSGQVSAAATDVNNAGNVTGFNLTSSTTADGFLDIGGVFTKLDFPGSVYTQAFGLNNNGQVVGSFVDSSGNTHGFLYTIATATYVEIDDPLGLNSTVINGINNNGQIVGFYTDANGSTDGFVGTPTPEPSSLLMLGTGLLGLVGVLRRKRLG